MFWYRDAVFFESCGTDLATVRAVAVTVDAIRGSGLVGTGSPGRELMDETV